MTNMEQNKGEIVMYQPDETIRLEVRMEGDTVWLNQAQMAELFGTKRPAITKHLQNIYDCEELKREPTSSILELVRKEGSRTVNHRQLYQHRHPHDAQQSQCQRLCHHHQIAAEPHFSFFATTFRRLAAALSQLSGAVVTTRRRFRLIFWNKPKVAVPLHRRKETDDNINKKFNNLKFIRL